MYTYDKRTIDSTGAFLLGELERLDQTLHMPLHMVSWQRDIELREDVSMADDISSFTLSSFASAGGIKASGKNWVGRNTTAIPGVALDIGKHSSPLHLWAMELSWTLPELEAARQLGRPIDSQKYEGMKLKFNLDVDEQVYIGDEDLGAAGLCNTPDIAAANSTLSWNTATPRQILDEINDLLSETWKRSAYSVVPDQLRLSPQKFSRLTQPVSDDGSVSLLAYISEQCIAHAENGRPLEIRPLKWLHKRGTGGKDRMLAYTRNKEYVRFPLVPMRKTALENRGISQITVYFSKLGQLEFVYPETLAYLDGE